jgi:DNA repair protein RadD
LLLNVGCFTTGFDVPHVDCVVLLRATQSPGLYVQMVGRGLRKAEGKQNCLLLDYGSNIETHGPLDMITVASIERDGVAPTKTCPQCESIIFAGFKACPDCGYIFPEPDKKDIKHGTRASEADPIKPITIEDVTVKEVFYERHRGKDGKKDTFKVTYVYGMWQRVSEWICPEHTGWAAEKAQAWFARRGVSRMPSTVTEALDVSDRLLQPGKISIKSGGKFPEIVRYDFSQSVQPKIEEEDDSNNLPF